MTDGLVWVFYKQLISWEFPHNSVRGYKKTKSSIESVLWAETPCSSWQPNNLLLFFLNHSCEKKSISEHTLGFRMVAEWLVLLLTIINPIAFDYVDQNFLEVQDFIATWWHHREKKPSDTRQVRLLGSPVWVWKVTFNALYTLYWVLPIGWSRTWVYTTAKSFWTPDQV